MFSERGAPFSDTCLNFTAIFCKIVIIFLDFFSMFPKETKKVMWHCCWSLSIILEHLIFIWKWRHLVVALFPNRWVQSNILSKISGYNLVLFDWGACERPHFFLQIIHFCSFWRVKNWQCTSNWNWLLTLNKNVRELIFQL